MRWAYILAFISAQLCLGVGATYTRVCSVRFTTACGCWRCVLTLVSALFPCVVGFSFTRHLVFWFGTTVPDVLHTPVNFASLFLRRQYSHVLGLKVYRILFRHCVPVLHTVVTFASSLLCSVPVCWGVYTLFRYCTRAT